MSENFPYVLGDRTHLIQSLMALFENAINAIGDRGEISDFSRGITTRDWVIVDIVDSGLGLIDLQLLFEVGLTRNEGRVALQTGVFGVKRVETMGGWLSIESQQAAGTRERLFFPVHNLMPREADPLMHGLKKRVDRGPCLLRVVEQGVMSSPVDDDHLSARGVCQRLSALKWRCWISVSMNYHERNRQRFHKFKSVRGQERVVNGSAQGAPAMMGSVQIYVLGQIKRRRKKRDPKQWMNETKRTRPHAALDSCSGHRRLLLESDFRVLRPPIDGETDQHDPLDPLGESPCHLQSNQPSRGVPQDNQRRLGMSLFNRSSDKPSVLIERVGGLGLFRASKAQKIGNQQLPLRGLLEPVTEVATRARQTMQEKQCALSPIVLLHIKLGSLCQQGGCPLLPKSPRAGHDEDQEQYGDQHQGYSSTLFHSQAVEHMQQRWRRSAAWEPQTRDRTIEESQ